MAKETKPSATTDREMEQTFGFVPSFFEESLPEHAHDQEWAIFRDFELAETVLPNKVKELIGLAVAAHIKCKYCIYFHAQAARMMGATDEELKEACFMGGHTVQMSNAISGMQLDFERFKKDVDKALEHMQQQQGAPAPH